VGLFAPHHAYGAPDDLKQLVAACHRRGLGAILDVVYNHLGPSGNYLGRPLWLIAESDLNDPRLLWPRERGGFATLNNHTAGGSIQLAARPSAYSRPIFFRLR
jgi:hypothetical protein